MRATSNRVALAALLATCFVAGRASAQGEPAPATASAPAPADAPTPPAAPTPVDAPAADASAAPAPTAPPSVGATTEAINVDTGTTPEKKKPKIWEVAGGYEYHRLWRRNDLGGAAVNSDVNVFSIAGTLEPTPLDRFRLRGFLYERFLADEGETGVRTDDLILSYTRTIPIKHRKIEPKDDGKVSIKPGAWLTAPTSFASKKASIVTVPRVYVSAEKTFFGFLHVEPRLSGDWYFVRYRTYEGGATPNTKARLGGGLNVEANVPQHKPLTFGLDFGTAYYWYYDAYGIQAMNSQRDPAFPGVVQDATYTSQPIQQTYGGEIYARYDLPAYKDVHADITLAAANGDPTLGYTSAIHEGARFFYLGYRQTAELYGALSVRY